MLKIFSIFAAALVLRRVARPVSEDREWRCDPLGHPALRAMSQAELGDLPWRGAAGGMTSCT